MRYLSRTLCFFSVVGNARLVLCDGQLSFWHCNIQTEPSPFLLRKFSTSSTLLWKKRQVADSLNATIAWPWSFCHVSVFSLCRSARGSSTVIFDRLALNVDLETEGLHSHLAARSTSSAIAPGRSSSPRQPSESHCQAGLLKFWRS